MMDGLLPSKPDFFITGCHVPGAPGGSQLQFWASRDIRRAELKVESGASWHGGLGGYADPGLVTVSITAGRLLVARAGSWPEAFEVLAHAWEQEEQVIQGALISTGAKFHGPAPQDGTGWQDIWVRVRVPA